MRYATGWILTAALGFLAAQPSFGEFVLKLQEAMGLSR